MGLVKVVDVLLFMLFLMIAIVAPLFDAQSCLPNKYYPKVLLDLGKWYGNEYGDYLVLEKPHFFVGLIWLELIFLWPLSIVNLFAMISGKSWFNTTCLIYGVTMFTSTVAILSEFIGSGRASDTLLMIYYPFAGLAALAILRGLIPSSHKTPKIGKRPALAGMKKRA